MEKSDQNTIDAINARIDRLEHVIVTLAKNIVDLLNENQRVRVRITRGHETQAHALKAQGFSNADIARLLRLSPASVCLLLKGKYKFGANVSPLAENSVEEILNNLIED